MLAMFTAQAVVMRQFLMETTSITWLMVICIIHTAIIATTTARLL